MKLAIVGSRSFEDYNLLHKTIWDILLFKDRPLLDVTEIISGGAKGADSLARDFATFYNYKLTEFLPDWETDGKSAGFKRNQQIVDECDGLIAFWDGESKGTKHSIDLAYKQKKLLKIVRF